MVGSREYAPTRGDIVRISKVSEAVVGEVLAKLMPLLQVQ